VRQFVAVTFSSTSIIVFNMKKLTFLISAVVMFTVPGFAFANHGPGTTGGGANTQSGETVKEGEFIFSLDENYTNYEDVSRQEAEARAARSGGFDAIRDSFTTSATVGYGVTNNFQIDAGIGWYSGRNFVDAHTESLEEEGHHKSADKVVVDHDDDNHGAEGETEEINSGIGNPEGLTDLMVRAKYRVMKGQFGHLSLIGGAVFPVGKDDVYLDNGEKLEPSSQPGSGRYSSLGGIAYSRYLTPRITMDASSIYTYRFERNNFRIGQRVDSGVALSYRLTEAVDSGMQFSLFTEINHQYIGKDEESGSRNSNTGGDIVYVTPGVRAGFNKRIGLIFAPSVPISTSMNGNQLKPDFRITSSLVIRF
jgi:Putative MetA-pathway of phenol degradation